MTAPAQTRRGRRADEGALGLLVEILRDSENLHGAKCVEYRDEFDPDKLATEIGYASESERWDMCQVVCRACPARGACWAWASRQHESRVSGPTAASQINPFNLRKRGRPRAEAPYRPRMPATPTPSPEDPEPDPSRPRPSQRRGARSRVRPSINRRHRRTRR